MDDKEFKINLKSSNDEKLGCLLNIAIFYFGILPLIAIGFALIAFILDILL